IMGMLARCVSDAAETPYAWRPLVYRRLRLGNVASQRARRLQGIDAIPPCRTDGALARVICSLSPLRLKNQYCCETATANLHADRVNMMETRTQISVRGKQTEVPAIRVENADIITTGKWLKMAAIKDEDYFEGNLLSHPATVIARFRQHGGKADVFSFSQRIPEISPKFDYALHWDNAAALAVSSYSHWWENLSQETRRNVRLASKRGLVVSAVPFSDKLARGILGIYNECPFRQGRRFWHYGKDFETVKRDNATYPGRSQFIAAYAGSELVGFIKMVYVDKVASIMQILSKVAHQDKRPTNALIAKAVEICAEKGV